MSGRDWAKNRQRQLIRDRGIDNIRDESVPAGLFGPRKRRKSKAEMRAELAQLMAAREKDRQS